MGSISEADNGGSRQGYRASDDARMRVQNTLYLVFGEKLAAMPNFVTPFFSIFARGGGESRQPEKASGKVGYPADTFSTASVAGYPDVFRRLASGALTSWSSLLWLAIACDCDSASFMSSGSTTPPARPLFCR